MRFVVIHCLSVILLNKKFEFDAPTYTRTVNITLESYGNILKRTSAIKKCVYSKTSDFNLMTEKVEKQNKETKQTPLASSNKETSGEDRVDKYQARSH